MLRSMDDCTKELDAKRRALGELHGALGEIGRGLRGALARRKDARYEEDLVEPARAAVAICEAHGHRHDPGDLC